MRKKHLAIIITVLAFLGLFIGNFGQYQVAAMPGAVFTKLMISPQQFASIMTGPMMLSIILSLVSGTLMDRFGIKPIVAIGLVLSSVGFVLRPFATSYELMLFAMVLSGLGCCIFNANISKIVGSLYAPEKIGRIIGVIMFGATFSMTVAFSTAVLFPTLELAFWVSAGFSLVVMILWFLLVSGGALKERSESINATSVPMKESLSKAVKSKDIWFMGLAFGFLLGGIMVTSTFQVNALSTIGGYSEAAANTFSTVLTIGNIVGTIAGPFMVVKFKRMKPFLIALMIIGTICTAFLIALPAGGMYAASFILGFVRSAFITIVISFPFFFKGIGPAYAGAAGGLASSLQVLGAVVLPTYVVVPLSGLFENSTQALFSLAAACMVIALIFTLLMSDIKKVKQEA